MFTDLAVNLQRRGHQVTVITTFPYYPEWQKKAGGRLLAKKCEEREGVRVIRHGIFVPSRPSRLVQRLLFEVSFAASATRSLFAFGRQDAVLVFCPMFGAVLFGALRGAIRREPLWLNIQDIPTDASLAAGIVKRGLFSRVAEFAQRAVFSRYRMWTTINEAMLQRLRSIGNCEIGPELCANWLTGSLSENIDSVRAAIPKSHMQETLQLLYSGNIGSKQGLLDFCKILHGTELKFRFQINGDGAAAGELWQWLDEVRDSRFIRGGFLEEPQFVEAIRRCDWFVITEKRNAGFSFIPSKLIPAISLATPILAISDRASPLGQEVTNHSLGLHFNWEHLNELEGQLVAASADAARQQHWQEKCEHHACTYGKRHALDRYETLLKQLVGYRKG